MCCVDARATELSDKTGSIVNSNKKADDVVLAIQADEHTRHLRDDVTGNLGVPIVAKH